MNGSRLKKITRTAALFLRKNALTETGLVSIFFLLFATSVIFLDTKIGRDLDPDTDKEWWTLSFETRNPSSLEFAIENHSENTDFSYEVTRDRIVLDEGAVSVGRGERKTITPSGSGDTAGRTTITVESGDDSKKSVYRER